MHTLQVTAGGVGYPVHIGRATAASIREALERHANTGLFLISDENVWRHHGPGLAELGESLILPPGEQTKSVGEWERALSWLARSGADRSSIIVAVGGGVVGDLAGFAAASYMRGIKLVNVATSLLAQIDAAIGGKTAIDLPEGKNLAGAFHHPVAVWCDPSHLSTLPVREFRSGMAEAVKYGLIMDAKLLDWQEKEHSSLSMREPDALEHLIKRCCELKSEVVAADAEERTGLRAVLNFGHTVAHALEKALGYKELLHGEAVMIGMAAEVEIGVRIGITPPAAAQRVLTAAGAWALPAQLPDKNLIEPMMKAMSHDKKNTGGRLAMSLLDDIGSCRLVRDVDPATVREALKAL